MCNNTPETSIYASPVIQCKQCHKFFSQKKEGHVFCQRDCRIAFHKKRYDEAKKMAEKEIKRKSHYAKFASSPRLQRVHKLLKDGNWYTTRSIIRKADVCNPNTCVWELRCNGFNIDQRWRGKISEYRLEGGTNADNDKT